MPENREPTRDELELRKQIEEFYLPKQLVDAIFEMGGIPRSSMEAYVGIGFIDIADYSYLSKFLSPKENQMVLNGLYTAFNTVLKRHGGYLNKIEGDSLMFHYGGFLDPRVRDLSEDEAIKYIARELFFSCIEMQRVCVLFNQANDRFLNENVSKDTREDLERAFEIISTLRRSYELSSSMNAFFQIRIRIGANIGEVIIGNFGPDGAKQWDVIGLPVIDAKRMESTAPIGGLRISEQFYRTLESTGIADDYYRRFRREAEALFGQYRSITKDELYKFGTVVLKDKKSVVFNTYSVQVNPGLPEQIQDQVTELLTKGHQGADRIVQMLQYYRGNPFVTNAIEKVFASNSVSIRKAYIYKLLFPKKYAVLERKFSGDYTGLDEFIGRKYSLYYLFESLGRYQDTIKQDPDMPSDETEFLGYESYLAHRSNKIVEQYNLKKAHLIRKSYFFNVVYPLVFTSIRTSILERQYDSEEEEIETLEELENGEGDAGSDVQGDVEELEDLDELEELG